MCQCEFSGHKFGLAYVGVGWVVWRDKAHLPKELIFELHYLGSVEYSFSLNFSRPAAPVIAQYFNFLHLGFEGYRAVAIDDFKNARLLSRALEKSGYYHVLSDIHRPLEDVVSTVKVAAGYDQEDIEVKLYVYWNIWQYSSLHITRTVQSYTPGLPVVAFRFSDDFQKTYPEIRQKWIQTLLRAKGWIVPNYELAPDLDNVEILRVVVRENMSEAVSPVFHLITIPTYCSQW
jgi:glutamate decarboxylase